MAHKCLTRNLMRQETNKTWEEKNLSLDFLFSSVQYWIMVHAMRPASGVNIFKQIRKDTQLGVASKLLKAISPLV